MFGKKKPKVLIWSVIISSVVLFGCQSDRQVVEGFEITGNTQGTTYSIIIAEKDSPIRKEQIDSLLARFDASLSTYVESSVISRINSAKDSISIEDPSLFFKDCYELSLYVYNKTNKAFDPSVFPLVKGWGFMNDMETPLSQNEVDSILQFVSFVPGKYHNVNFVENQISFVKNHPNFKLDFNAIAQGQSVDVLARFLESKGCKNFYIEIGGELYVKGINREGEKWRIGVDTPNEDGTRTLENILSISNNAVATSGNYRKFYIKDGVKYAHTLSPQTGFPVQHSLLSATVVARNCALADAYATAFMVIGADASLKFIEDHPEEELAVYLLSADDNGVIKRQMSTNFNSLIAK